MVEATDEELKRKLMEFIGAKIAKYGDTYDYGSSFFTKASLIIDEKIYKQKIICDGPLPKYQQYEPILSKKIRKV